MWTNKPTIRARRRTATLRAESRFKPRIAQLALSLGSAHTHALLLAFLKSRAIPLSYRDHVTAASSGGLGSNGAPGDGGAFMRVSVSQGVISKRRGKAETRLHIRSLKPCHYYLCRFCTRNQTTRSGISCLIPHLKRFSYLACFQFNQQGEGALLFRQHDLNVT